MRAALSPHLSDPERRALATFAVLAGGFVIVTAIAVTAVMVTADDIEDGSWRASSWRGASWSRRARS